MRSVPLAVAGLLALAAPAAPAAPAAELHLDYDIYAAGLQVADVRAALALGPVGYQISVAYHTTGLINLLYSGHQLDRVDGVWQAGRPLPRQYDTTGVWRGENRMTVIRYRDGDPHIDELMPPNLREREPVPLALQAHSIDTLSALALLIRDVADTSRCDIAVRTYDGRRATEITAHTVGWERLPPTGRSSFSGPALRCDFAGRLLAGVRRGPDNSSARKPLHGSAWFAAALPGDPPLPVRMRFETSWFGDATMYLSAARPGSTPQPARH